MIEKLKFLILPSCTRTVEYELLGMFCSLSQFITIIINQSCGSKSPTWSTTSLILNGWKVTSQVKWTDRSYRFYVMMLSMFLFVESNIWRSDSFNVSFDFLVAWCWRVIFRRSFQSCSRADDVLVGHISHVIFSLHIGMWFVPVVSVNSSNIFLIIIFCLIMVNWIYIFFRIFHFITFERICRAVYFFFVIFFSFFSRTLTVYYVVGKDIKYR